MDDGSSLYGALVTALWSDTSAPESASIRNSLCKCSCATEIIYVFGGILQQWSMIDTSMNVKRMILQTMCMTDNRKKVSAFVTETTSVQCSSNTLSISVTVLTPNSTVPAGSLITVTGLNANPQNSGINVQISPPATLSAAEWVAASCVQNCICSDKPQCNMTGLSQGSRCSVWCTSDSILKITTKSPFQNALILLNLENGAVKQVPPQVFIEINGPGFYAAPTLVISAQASEVLSFSVLPSLGVITVTEELPDNFDSSNGIWRGSAAGQRNTLQFSILPNLDILPGALITISGLTRSNYSVSFPSIRQISGNVGNISVHSWIPLEGTVILVVGGQFFDNTVIIGAMQSVIFGLELETPCQSSSSPATCQAGLISGAYPTITIEASRVGPSKRCTTLRQAVTGQVLVPKQSSTPFFPFLSISSSTCFPGECNKMTLTITVNRCIAGSDNMYILVSGLVGMDIDSKCLATCSKDSLSVQLQDAVAGIYQIESDLAFIYFLFIF